MDNSKTENTLKFTGKDSSIKGIDKLRFLNKLSSFRRSLRAQLEGKTYLTGNIPNILIGDYGYPSVNAGFLSSQNQEERGFVDSPLVWKSSPDLFPIDKIITLRSSIVNSKTNIQISKLSTNSFSDKLKEVSLAINPVDAEVSFSKKISFYDPSSFSFKQDLLPHGPTAVLKNIVVNENPKVPVFVQKFESDTDLKASSAILELRKKNFDEHYLTKIFSGGNLGTKLERKIVPTKWSITAVDDTLGKNMISTREHFESCSFSAFFGGYLGNYYLVLFFPGPWSFELFETYVGSGLSNPDIFESAQDFEGAFSRKSYASNTVGGYYASRLAVLEYLERKKVNGRVLVLRFITEEYWAPLGVWVVREASRTALNSPAMEFESETLMLKYAEILLKKRFNVNLSVFLAKSKLYKEMKSQTRINNF